MQLSLYDDPQSSAQAINRYFPEGVRPNSINLDELNNEQRAAVLCTEGPLLVLAGAGSGKTRVLTYRIAHIIENLRVSPYQILAITFTNKAAAEMRERLNKVLTGGMRGMWVATFHAMCVRMLRQDADKLGYTKNFTIYDDDDSKRLMKSIYNDLNIEPKQYPINSIRERISKAKNDLKTAVTYEASASNAYERLIARVYTTLQERLKRADAMDFDDLLVNTWILLSKNEEVLKAYQNRFRYIHIDEYQDTNGAQYAIAQLLAAAHHNIMVVGDDDQSIYSWRGANIRNILEFERDYSETTVIKLEQNYRSTKTILEAANAVIANNTRRKSKRLFTDGAKGDKIALYQAFDERDEGRWIASEIERLRRGGRTYNDFALFYRTNAQSRILEDMLLRAGIPYRIVGGTRFFDRAEIRDVMAYLKLVVNTADDVAAKRIINVPKRGIGKTSIEKIEDIARRENTTFFDALELSLSGEEISGKTLDSIAKFVQLIKDAQHYAGNLREIVEMIVSKTGMIEALLADHTDEARGRVENIQEFFGVAEEFEQTHEDSDLEEAYEEALSVTAETPTGASEASPVTAATPSVTTATPSINLETPSATTVTPSVNPTTSSVNPATPFVIPATPSVIPAQAGIHSNDPVTIDTMLIRFMEWLALRSDLDTIIAGEDFLTMMTIHSAKGLEFPVVFIAGMEESLFPHIASSEDSEQLEEERRLAYVAITRARELLHITHAQARNIFGYTQVNPRSRFVAEIPTEFIKPSGVGSSGYQGVGYEKRGDRHGQFGTGSFTERDTGRVFGQGGLSAASKRDADQAHKEQLKKEREAQVFKVGDDVDHKTFGRGKIVNVDGDVLHIKFTKVRETKKLLKGYAPIVKITP